VRFCLKHTFSALKHTFSALKHTFSALKQTVLMSSFVFRIRETQPVYQNYRDIICSKFSRNNHFNSNYNQISEYNNRTQGLTVHSTGRARHLKDSLGQS